MSLCLIIGPMFSGKTTELIRRITRYEYSGKSCIILKSHIDTRFSEITSHSCIKYSNFKSLRILNELDSISYDVIGIDEGQFFIKEDLDLFIRLNLEKDKIIIISALDCDYKMNEFNQIVSLVYNCEEVIKLTAICKYCKNNASFTKRLSKSKELILVGGDKDYVPVCRKCYSI